MRKYPTWSVATVFLLGCACVSLIGQSSYQAAKTINAGISAETRAGSLTASRIGNALNGTLDAASLVTERKTTGFAAVPGYLYVVSTASGTVAVTTPTAPTKGDRFGVTDETGTWATNNCTVDFGNYPLHGQAAPNDNIYVGNGNYATRFFQFDGTRWLIR